MANGTTEYTVLQGENSDSFSYGGPDYEEGYIYIHNYAGTDDLYAIDLRVGPAPGPAPSRKQTQEPEPE